MNEDVEAEWRRAVRQAMAEQGLDQAAVAARLGVSRVQVTQLLSGSRGHIPGSVLRLLDALGLELTVRRKSDQHPGK